MQIGIAPLTHSPRYPTCCCIAHSWPQSGLSSALSSIWPLKVYPGTGLAQWLISGPWSQELKGQDSAQVEVTLSPYVGTQYDDSQMIVIHTQTWVYTKLILIARDSSHFPSDLLSHCLTHLFVLGSWNLPSHQSFPPCQWHLDLPVWLCPGLWAPWRWWPHRLHTL